MEKATSATGNPGGRTGVRIVVAGDHGTGKSCFIVTAIADTFLANVSLSFGLHGCLRIFTLTIFLSL